MSPEAKLIVVIHDINLPRPVCELLLGREDSREHLVARMS